MTATLAASLLLPLPVLCQELQLSNIIANVRANEELYKDIDVVHHRSYQQNSGADAPPPARISLEEESRTVFQGEFFYRSEDQVNKKLVGAESKRYLTVVGYDGDLTRRFYDQPGGRTANLHHERFQDAGFFHPHTWILALDGVHVPLSLWLQGGSRLSKHPNAFTFKDVDQSASVVGLDKIDGIECFKLKCESRTRDNEKKLVGLWDLWLAPRMNYLPVKFNGYALRVSAEIPLAVTTASDFKELSPGIWLAHKFTCTRWDPARLSKGERLWGNKQEGRISKVSLSPSHPKSFFSDIPIPKGTLVYEVKNGVAQEGYIEGAPRREPPSSKSYFYWYVAIAAAAVSLVAWYYLRRKRARTAA